MKKYKDLLLFLLIIGLFSGLYIQKSSLEQKCQTQFESKQTVLIDSLNSIQNSLDSLNEEYFILSIDKGRYEVIYNILSEDPYCKKKLEEIQVE